MQTPSTASPLALLEQAVAQGTPVRGLDPERYASTHAIYEACSDQRQMVRDWMVTEIPRLVEDVEDRPVAVLGVGVGDGSVDVPLAARLAADERAVDYHGIEPHGPSLEVFEEAMAGLGLPKLTVTTSASGLDGYTGDGPFDVVHFVHSMYYVPDVGEAIERALALLRPGGSLVTLTSPREPLSVLSSILAPQPDHPHWFADAVAAELVARGLPIATFRIDGRLQMASVRDDPHGAGGEVLDFLLQCYAAELDPAVLGLVHDHLSDIALDDDPDAVPHPLDVVIATAV